MTMCLTMFDRRHANLTHNYTNYMIMHYQFMVLFCHEWPYHKTNVPEMHAAFGLLASGSLLYGS